MKKATIRESYIKLHRKILDWEWYNRPEVLSVFIYCLLRANYEDAEYQGIKILRGQFMTSPDKIAHATGLTYQNVRTALNKLISTNEISKQSTNKYTIITICNYDSYQSREVSANNQLTSNLTNDQQTTNKQLTTSKKNIESKEEKETKNYKNILLSEIKISDFPELNDEYLKITKAFYELFKSNLIDAGAKTTTLEKAKGTWIDDIRLTIESDNYTMDDLRDVYKFLQRSEFWKKNIISTDKLRKQMVKLKLEIKNEQSTANNQGHKSNPRGNDAKERRASVANLKELSIAILQQPGSCKD